METKFKIKPLLSYSPGKAKENVYRVRARAGRNVANLPQIEIRETLLQANREPSFSPRKNRLNSPGLFKNAHRISSAETFLTN